MDRARSASEVLIASAFYDTGFLARLIEATEASFRIVLNGFRGERFRLQREELNELIESYKDRLEIRVRFERGLFHSKAYLFDCDSLGTALVGSANATSAAFSKNEEILIEVDDVARIYNYFEQLWEDEKSLDIRDENEPKITSLVALFRTGSLAFKSNTTLAFGFNPFTKLVNALPGDIRSKLSLLPLEFSDDGAIGGFSLKKALDWKVDDEAPGRKRFGIKKDSVESCFGFWIPSQFVQSVNERQEAVSETKLRDYCDFAEALERRSDKEIVDKYQRYLDGCSSLLKEAKVRWQDYLPDGPNPFHSEKQLLKVVERLRDRIGDSSYLARLTMPYNICPVPEIWSDKVDVRNFMESAFDYLDYVYASGKKQHVASCLVGAAQRMVHEGSSESWIREGLELYLKEYGWKASRDWSLRRWDT